MILLFLGSWRSTVIIATSIPLAILAAVAGLSAAGETLNIMTLGGLALAVGILVDDATVTIENINWHLEQGKTVRAAIMDGAEQIVRPAFVSLLCICIAFVPMFFLPGVAGFLFAPMAKAVVFAMIASFVLSRTLVPTMSNYLLRDHASQHTAEIMASHDALAARAARPSAAAFPAGFEHRFEKVRAYYVSVLVFALERRRVFVPAFMAVVLASLALVPFLAATSSRASIRADQPARPRAGGHAAGGNGGAVRPYRGRDPAHRAEGRTGVGGRQHRPAGVGHQPRLFQHRRRRPAGRRYPHHAGRRAPAHGGLCPCLRERLPRVFPARRSRSCRPTSSARS
jgi:hypothetical protein